MTQTARAVDAGLPRVVTLGAAVLAAAVGTVYLGHLGPRAAVVEIHWPTTLGLIALMSLVAVLASVLLVRRPENRMGLVFTALALLMAVQLPTVAYLEASFSEGMAPLAGATAVGVLNLAGPPAFWMIIAFVLFWFPNGEVPSSRWRPVSWMAAAVYGLSIVISTFSHAPLIEGGPINPLAIDAMQPVAALLGSVFWAASNLMVIVAAASLVARYRTARGIERRQLKWLAMSGVFVVSGGAVMLLGVVLKADEGVFTVAGLLFGIGLVTVPVFATLAILRYRLYDIDRIVSRTVSYAVLSGVLGAVYGGAVFVLSAMAASLGGGSEVAVAGATLAVAGAFRPARSRVQHVVNRKFNRARYDAERTVQGFAERLRDRVDVEDVRRDLLQTTIGVVQPARAQLWLRSDV